MKKKTYAVILLLILGGIIMYERVNWQNSPSTATPVSADNLNKMDKGIADIDSQLAEITINVKNLPIPMISATGDGVTDDRVAIQNAIDLLPPEGGTILFPEVSDGGYFINSEHPDYLGHALILNKKNIKLVGQNGSLDNRIIKLGKDNMISVFYAPTTIKGFGMKNMSINANYKADYCLKADDEYSSFVNLENSQFDSAKISCVSVSTFVATFERCIFIRSLKYGLTLKGVGVGPVTSVSLISCYANNNAERGYNFGLLNYCTLISCAADNNDIAYYFQNAYGVSMISCGVESGRKAIHIEAFRNFSISTFYGLGMGTDSETPDYLIEFVSGYAGTLKGIMFTSTKQIKNILGLTGSGLAKECIVVEDNSLTRDDVDFIPNYTFDRPIRMVVGDTTTKDETFNIGVDELQGFLKNWEYKEINHVITIQLADGTQPDLSTAQIVKNLKGNGKLIIQGNANDRSLVKLVGGQDRLRVVNCNPLVIFKDLNLENRFNSGYSKNFICDNSKVVLDNVMFTSTVANNGCAIECINGSKIYLINNTIASHTNYQHTGVYKVFEIDDSSQLILEKGDTAPTEGFWGVGVTREKLNPVSGESMGFLCTTAGNPPVWKEYGAIT